MISDKLSSEHTVIAEAGNAAFWDISDKIAALVFRGEGDKINSGTAAWAAKVLKEIENEYCGIVILGGGDNFCSATAVEGDSDPLQTAKSFQSLTTTIKHYGKPVVSILKGEVFGIGYEIALNSHALLAYPKDIDAGYNLAGQGYSPMGGGLTSQIIDTYAIGDNTPGHDIVPFLKKLISNVCFYKKPEDTVAAIAKGILPKETRITKSEEDILEKGKQKVLSMYLEGFEAVEEKSIAVTGETGSAALGVMLVNMLEGGFITRYVFDIGCKVAEIIGGGNVPKGTIVTEGQLLKLEALAYADIVEQERGSKGVEK